LTESFFLNYTAQIWLGVIMSEQQESVHIQIKSLGRAVEFPVRSSEPCKKCKGSGKKDKRPCPYCCGSGRVKMLDCIQCNGTKVAPDKTPCKCCKGTGALTEVKTREFLDAREFCENFKKNPAKTILICLACLIALGVCARIISGYAFVYFMFLKTWPCYVSLLVGLGAGFYVLVCLNKMNKGSYLPAATKGLISVGVIALWIAAIAIPGPVTGRYWWIEKETKSTITDALAEQGVACQKVKVRGNDGDVYHAIATLSDGNRVEVNTYFKDERSHGRKIAYSIHVEPVKKYDSAIGEE